jgi:hypothetical protein
MLEDRCVPSTLTVTNTLDSGAGSLRADVAAAASGDTIVFNIPKSDPGYNTTTGVWTITLTSGELLITKSLSITGPGETELTISGNHASRVFDLEQSGKNKTHQFIPQVSLSGMTISNASSILSAGAILNNGACSLTITNSILSNNSAGSQGQGDGGAIYNVGTLTVNGCTLTGNYAPSGGGAIENLGTLTVSSSFITNNSASIFGGGGGGIDNTGTATLTATTLSGNSAGFGGGIENLSGTLTLNGCTLYGNSGGSYGGGIWVASGTTINLSGCTLADNSAYEGGAIFISYATTVTISGTVIGPATVGGILLPGNSASQGGGGIYFEGGTLYVKNSSTITGNSAPAGSGADVYNLGTVYVDSTINTILWNLYGNQPILR